MEITTGLVIGGIVGLAIFYAGFSVGRQKGAVIVADLERRHEEAKALLRDVRNAAEKGSKDLEATARKVKDRAAHILEV